MLRKRLNDDECPGEDRCALSTKRPIGQAIAQCTTAKEMGAMQRNPPRDLIDATCEKCPLLPSKPGYKSYPQNLLAAADAASTVDKRIQAGYNGTEMTPRLLSALLGIKTAQNKFESELVKNNKSTPSTPSIPEEAFID